MSVVSRLFEGPEHGILLWWTSGFEAAVLETILICNRAGTGVILVCPAHLKTMWTQVLVKAGLSGRAVRFLNFSNLTRADSFAGHVVIVDEAHNILDLTRGAKTGGKPADVTRMMSLFSGSRKVVLMTRTPVHSSLSDLTFLVNIAAGRQIVPFNRTLFDEKYYGINTARSLFYGQYFAAANAASSLVLLSSIVVNVGRFSVRKHLILEAEKSLADDARFLAFLKTVVNQSVGEHFISNHTSLNLGSTVGKDLTGDKQLIALFKDSAINNPSVNFMEFVFFYAKHVIVMNPNLAKSMTNVLFVAYVVVVIMVLLYYILLVIDLLSGIGSDMPRFKSFKATLFARDIFRHVSCVTSSAAFDYEETRVPYSDYQMDVWIKLTQEMASAGIIRDLNISKNFKYESAKITADQYLDHGIFVGNLRDPPPTRAFSPKFAAILGATRGKRAAVYSNSVPAGLQLFRDFLDARKVPYLFLDIGASYTDRERVLEQFATGPKRILLVHPLLIEGYVVDAAEQLHIMEPIRDVHRRDQLIARFSGPPGPSGPSGRPGGRLEVRQWISANSTAMSKLMRLFYSAKNWLKYKSEVMYFVDYNKFSQVKTPDQIVNESTEQITEDLSKIRKAVVKLRRARQRR